MSARGVGLLIWASPIIMALLYAAYQIVFVDIPKQVRRWRARRGVPRPSIWFRLRYFIGDRAYEIVVGAIFLGWLIAGYALTGGGDA